MIARCPIKLCVIPFYRHVITVRAIFGHGIAIIIVETIWTTTDLNINNQSVTSLSLKIRPKDFHYSIKVIISLRISARKCILMRHKEKVWAIF